MTVAARRWVQGAVAGCTVVAGCRVVAGYRVVAGRRMVAGCKVVELAGKGRGLGIGTDMRTTGTWKGTDTLM